MQFMLPSMELSKSQIDRLGGRLRKGDINETDLRLLDGYRRSFGDAYEDVVREVSEKLYLEPTGRPAKSTTSIIDKLQRESIRLSQMQDIAGCRLTVADILTQDAVVAQLVGLFDKATVVDRREHPSHGYRAVHVIVDHSGKLIEVQVRTLLQHLWAELSEKLSDIVDKEIKYGGGSNEVAVSLATMSEGGTRLETLEREFQTLLVRSAKIRSEWESTVPSDEVSQRMSPVDRAIEDARKVIIDERQGVIESIREVITRVTKEREPQ
jgi:ppGpp synthetase/RelA/SpoT-type nucleotidyltranferase